MIIKSQHKKAARYFIVGMTPTQIARILPPYTPTQIRRWYHDLQFKEYLSKVEDKHLELLDKDINHLKRAAIARLKEIVDTPRNDKHFEMQHFEWAVNKVFQITMLREKTLNINQEVREGKPVESQEAKQALKDLVRLTGDTQRYGQAKMGEA